MSDRGVYVCSYVVCVCVCSCACTRERPVTARVLIFPSEAFDCSVLVRVCVEFGLKLSIWRIMGGGQTVPGLVKKKKEKTLS